MPQYVVTRTRKGRTTAKIVYAKNIDEATNSYKTGVISARLIKPVKRRK